MIPGALVVTHGELGSMLVAETQRLVGQEDRFQSLRTEGLSAGEITDRITEMIGEEPWIVFTDAPGTSPTMRARAAIVDGQAVITGVNICMLMSFLIHRNRLTVDELAAKMIEDGKRSLECWTGQ
jgi:mannose/fructose-specific phosphotransferase system component IIA